MNSIAPYAKAVVAFLVPFLTQVGAALVETSDGGTAITGNEWLTALLTSLAAAGVVYAVPNKDKSGEHQDESVQPPLA